MGESTESTEPVADPAESTPATETATGEAEADTSNDGE